MFDVYTFIPLLCNSSYACEFVAKSIGLFSQIHIIVYITFSVMSESIFFQLLFYIYSRFSTLLQTYQVIHFLVLNIQLIDFYSNTHTHRENINDLYIVIYFEWVKNRFRGEKTTCTSKTT